MTVNTKSHYFGRNFLQKKRVKWRLHPLIHTFPSGNSAQNLVAWSQDEKCGLKYDIHTSTSSVRTLDQNDTAFAKKKAPTYQKKCVGEGLKGVRSIDS